MKPRVYIETSVISYLTSKPSRDLIIAGHQRLTLDWWDRELPKFNAVVSPIVLDEVARGDPGAPAERLKVTARMKLLPVDQAVRQLAARYLGELGFPEIAKVDALHLAVAAFHAVDYLVTWNCRHIANGRIIKRLTEVNLGLDIATPVICTPEELMEY